MKKEQELTLQKNRNSLDTMQLKIHNQMARTLARFEEPEHAKLFLISLGSLLKSSDNIAHISKIELFDKLKVPKEDKNKHKRYFDMFNSMRKRTEFDITIDEDTQIAGNIISLVKRTRNEYLIKFEGEMAPTLKELKGQYTLLYIDSIMQFKSSYSITLYNYLLSWHNKSYKINKQWLSTKQLKELFGLNEDDYVRPNGTFNRNAFETRTIQRAVDEIINVGYMYIRWYKAKDKLTKKIIAYVFEFVILDRDKKNDSGIEFTELKYGKVDDVIISDEFELNVEPTWINQDSAASSSDDEEWVKTYKDITNNELTREELEDIRNLILGIFPDNYVEEINYFKDEYGHFKAKESKKAQYGDVIKNRYEYFRKMLKNDIEEKKAESSNFTIFDYVDEPTPTTEPSSITEDTDMSDEELRELLKNT